MLLIPNTPMPWAPATVTMLKLLTVPSPTKIPVEAGKALVDVTEAPGWTFTVMPVSVPVP